MSFRFQDSFNRADENLDVSPGWTRVDGTAGWGAIRSGRLACTTSDAVGAAYQCPDTGSTTHYVQGTLTDVTSDSGAFLCVRLQDRGNFVGVRYDGVNGNIEMYRRNGGTLTLLRNVHWPCNVGDVLMLRVSGGDCSSFLNGNGVANVLGDATIAGMTSTRCGVVMRAVVAVPWVDNFEAATWPQYLTFPVAPAVGRIYAPGGQGPGATWYIWDGTAWVRSRSNVGPPSSGFRNYIINGNHLLWQRGTNFPLTTGTRYTADRWYAYSSGTTHLVNRYALPMGGPADIYPTPVPPAALILQTASVAGANNYGIIEQRIESARTLAGRRATLSFWATGQLTAGGPINIAVEMYQYTGSGGSPTGAVSFFQKKIPLDISTWPRFVMSFDVPSLAGKTLGSAGDDSLWVRFWVDAGSTYNAQTANLGQQSGTIYLANIQLEAGNVATPFERRPDGIEFALCDRYFESGYRYCFFSSPSAGGYADVFDLPFRVHKRATPTMTRALSSQQVLTGVNDWATYPWTSYCQVIASGAGVAGAVVTWTADAELR